MGKLYKELNEYFVGNVPVAGVITPSSPLDTYGIIPDNYVIGGYKSVKTLDEMNKLTIGTRRLGMIVYVINEDVFYMLKGDDNNATFEKLDLKPGVDSGALDELLKEKLSDYVKLADYNLEISNINSAITNLDQKHKLDIEKLKQMMEDIGILDVNKDYLYYKEIVISEDNVKQQLNIKTASGSNLGLIKPDNKTVVVEEDGTLKSVQLKVDDITIENVDGTIQVSKSLVDKITEIFKQLPITPGEPGIPPDYPLKIATLLELGISRPDGKTLTIDKEGVMSVINKVNIATPAELGLVKPDDHSIGITSDGTIYIKDFVNTLKNLKDVDVRNMTNKKGYALVVNQKGDGFELRRPDTLLNENSVINVDFDEYTQVFDFTKYVNTGVTATMEAVNTDPSKPITLKYISRTGGEVTEPVDVVLQRSIPSRDFGFYLEAKGKGKIILDILTLN